MSFGRGSKGLSYLSKKYMKWATIYLRIVAHFLMHKKCQKVPKIKEKLLDRVRFFL